MREDMRTEPILLCFLTVWILFKTQHETRKEKPGKRSLSKSREMVK